MSEDVYRNYLRDLGYILRENAIKAKEDFHAAKDPEDRAFRQGFRMAYYDVVTIMQQQQIAFYEVSDSDLAFEDFDPERDVLIG
jgi:hypothetical protein